MDAFTTRLFGGNPAGVVLGAQLLTDAEMQASRASSATATPRSCCRRMAADHDLRVRFFTPRTEAAFVGHATLATHAVLAPRLARRRLVQQQRAGAVGVSIEGDFDSPRIGFTQPAPPLGRAPDARELDEVLAALGLGTADLDERCPPVIAGTASTRLLLGLADAARLAQLEPDLPRLAALSARLGAAGYFVFTLATRIAGCFTEARMFCPAIGIDEDPVSGNAHAMLAAFLHRHDLLPAPPAGDAAGGALLRFESAQGHHLGRPGRVYVALRPQAPDAPVAVSISGDAVIVFGAQMRL